MARLASISQSFSVARQKTEEATHRILVATAKREHGKVMRTPPRPHSFTRYVDGREGAPEDSVRADGVITYIYPRLEHVARYAMEVLFDLSPVLSGAYRQGHTLMLNGKPAADLSGWRPGDEIAITNMLPYARKIELGRMKMRVPGSAKVYRQAVRKVKARFGSTAKIGFAFRGIVGGQQISVQRRSRSRGNSDLRYPVMTIAEL